MAKILSPECREKRQPDGPPGRRPENRSLIQLIDHAISENFILLLATTISSDDKMDAAPTNLGTNANNAGDGNGGDERRPGEEGAGGSGRKDKGKGR
jgi:hypothetical protein